MSARRGPAAGLAVVALLALAGAVPPRARAELPFPEAYQALSVSQGGRAVALADFDEDGHADLILVDARGLCHLFPGTAGPWFQADSLVVRMIDPDLRYDYVSAAGGGDFDGDGHADLFLAGDTRTTILYGDGRGGFAPGYHFDMGRQGSFGALVDLNGDGRPDLVGKNLEPAGVNVRLARTRGIFGALNRYPLSERPRAMAVGDMDRDGAPDIVATAQVGDSLWVLRNDGAGAFAPRTAIALDGLTAVYEIALGDLNGDGALDLAAGGRLDLEPDYQYVTCVRFGDGRGGFTGGGCVAPIQGDLGIADVDGDGHADLLISSDSLAVLPGRGDGTFGAARTWPIGAVNGLTVTLVEGGGLRVVGPTGSGATVAWLDPAGPPPPLPAFASPGRPNDPRLIDLDGDGRLDLLGYASRYAFDGWPADATVLLSAPGLGDGGFGPFRELPLDDAYPYLFVTGEWTGDGVPDLLMPTRQGARLRLYAGSGEAGFTPAGEIQLESEPRLLFTGDLNGDGRLDLIVSLYTAPEPRVFLAAAGGGFAAPVTLVGFLEARNLFVADFTGDGHADLLQQTYDGSPLLLWPGRGDGTFAASRATTIPAAGVGQMAAGDLDGDGRLDLVVLGSPGVSIYLNEGEVGFAPPRLYPSTESNADIRLADFDADGRTDILLAPGFDPPILILNEGEGRFTAPRGLGLAGGIRELAVGDLNGDARPDLLLADWSAQRWVVALNRGVAALPTTRLAARVDDWTVTLDWDWTATGPGTGYALYRWRSDGTAGVRLALMTERPGAVVTFTDHTLVTAGRYRYELRQLLPDASERAVAAQVVDVQPALGGLRLLGVWPNPARGGVTLELTRGAAGADAVLVFDARGRLVRRVAVRAPGPGRWRAAWDLRDDAGRAVVSGVYFARPADAGGAATRLVVAR